MAQVYQILPIKKDGRLGRRFGLVLPIGAGCTGAASVLNGFFVCDSDFTDRHGVSVRMLGVAAIVVMIGTAGCSWS